MNKMIYSEKEWSLVGFKRGVKKKVIAVLKNKKDGRVRELGFGQLGSSTYWDRTMKGGDQVHGDKKKRDAYRARHVGEGNESKKYSPGWLAYHWLW